MELHLQTARASSGVSTGVFLVELSHLRSFPDGAKPFEKKHLAE
jgi:hypothetical protein